MQTHEKPERAPIYFEDEAAVYLGIDRVSKNPSRTMRHLVSTGQLQHVKIVGRRAFLQSHLDAYITRQNQKQNGRKNRRPKITNA